MSSTAVHLGQIVPALSIQVNNLVYELKSQGEDVIVLSLGEAFFDIPLLPFDTLPMPDGYHYSHSRGLPALRQRLATYYREQYGVPVDADSELLVTAGSKIAIHMVLMAMLDPGDEVVVLEPAWVSYSEQVKLCHGVPVMAPYDCPVSALEQLVTPRTKAIIVNNPNNPSGHVLTVDELTCLHELAERHDLLLLADEAYSEFVRGDAFVSLGAMDPRKEHTVVCNSMSKNYGVSGWRIGYVIGNPQLIGEILKINQHLVTCAPTILQQYLARYFDGLLDITRPQIAQVVEMRRELAQLLEEEGLSALPGDSTFYFFVSLGASSLSSLEFCTRLLKEHHVSTVPGIGYGQSCDRFIRVSIGTESIDRVREGIRRIARLMRETTVPADVRAVDAFLPSSREPRVFA